MKLVNTLQQRARQTPDEIAVRENDQIFSYAQWWQQIEYLSALFRRHKISCLGLALPNSFMWLACDLAAQHAGITLVPIPAFFSDAQKQHMITESGCDFLITNEIFDSLQKVLALPNQIYVYATGLPASKIPAQTCKITFTSGSTGKPKGVCLSLPLLETISENLADQLMASNIKRHCVFLPMSILLENIASIYVPLLLGAQIIICQQSASSAMSMETLLNTLFIDAPNSLLLTAQSLRWLIDIVQIKLLDFLFHLKFVAVGGSKISSSLIQQAHELGVPVYEGYGLSECGSVVSMNTPACYRLGSVGQLLPDVKIRIAEDGEIVVARPHLLGYIGDAFVPPEIKTGDIGYIDEDGFLFVTGRKKSIFINSFGRNISPEWIEAEAQCCSAIAHLVVVGEAKPFNVAVVQPKTDNLQLIETDIKTLNDHLPDYAQIKKYILTKDPFTPQNGLLTYNGRPKRNEIYSCYKHAIDSIYQTEVRL